MADSNKQPVMRAMTPLISNYEPDQGPELYAQDILKHSERSPEHHLWSGVNYHHLAQFLKPSRSPSLKKNLPISAFPFTILHTFAQDGSNTVQEFDGDNGPSEFSGCISRYNSTAKIAFMRGYLTTSWLKTIGATLRVDPEFFRRHLDFNSPDEFYDLPPLPSTAKKIIRLRFTTVFSRNSLITPKKLAELRAEEEYHVREHQKQLSSVGESVIRRFSVHDNSFFSIEQDISIYVRGRANKGWQMIVWSDSGRDLSETPPGPWLDARYSTASTLQAACLPIVYHHPKIAFKRRKSQATAHGTHSLNGKRNNLFQSASLLPTQYGLTLDPKIVAVDALYAMSELFTFVAGNEHQFLNMLGILIKKEMNPNPEHMEQAIDNLNHMKTVIERHHEYLEDAIRCLNRRGDEKWPRATAAEQAETVERRRLSILEDFEYLLGRAKQLSENCTTGCNAITNSTMVQEARAGLEQGAQMKRLTILAFLYLPATLTTSFFGMNFREFGQGSLGMYWGLAAFVPITAMSLVLFFWSWLSNTFRNLNVRAASQHSITAADSGRDVVAKEA